MLTLNEMNGLNQTTANLFFDRTNKPTGRCVRARRLHKKSSSVGRQSAFQAQSRSLPVRFDPETRFDLPTESTSVSYDSVDHEFARMKETMLEQNQATTEFRFEQDLIRFAVNEAEALAWTSPFPLLVFPALTQEKTDQARKHFQKQQEIWRRSQTLLSNVA